MLSLELEEALASGTQVVALSVDIYKAFDQLSRPLLALLGIKAGAPLQVIDAWFRFSHHMVLSNAINGHFGVPYTRACGIAQGCPLSMMWLALALRPLHIRMAARGMAIRTLADDVLLHDSGKGSWKRLRVAGSEVHQFIIALGGKMAPDKSRLFATSPAVRASMR
eukprot:13559704-Alexandrium_andersonii.AAC.1